MPVTSHQHWYDQTTENGYPLADNATRLDDDGKVIPPGIVIDLNLRHPDPGTPESYVFISAVTCGPALVTVAINRTTDLEDPGQLIAVATLNKKSDRHLVKLTPMIKGVGGWVVFGPNTTGDQLLSFRFSLPTQSLLAQRATAPYPVPRISYMKTVQAATKLEGIVQLFGQAPFNVRKEIRTIDGADRKCIIFSLLNDQGDEFSSSDIPVLQQFLGPCDTRPESNTCPDPQPIESVSQVSPDCDGQLILELRGCAQATRYTDGHGFVINCSIPRQAVCPPPKIPDDDGTLPNEYNPVTVTGTSTTTTGITQPPDGESGGTLTLPFTECFRDGTVDAFATIQGQFNFVTGYSDPYTDPYCTAVTDNGYTLQAAGVNESNLAGWVGTDSKTVERAAFTDVKLIASGVGTLINGGLMLNFRYQGGTPRYFLVIVDYLRQAGIVYYFNGFTLLQIAINPMVVMLDAWISVLAITVDYGNLGVGINCTFTDLDNGGTEYLNTLPLNYYRPSDGIDGIASINSSPVFSYFRYEVYPMILTNVGFLEYRKEKDLSAYPFTTRASLRNRNGNVILENTFVDLSLYPVGIQNGAYLSQVEVSEDQITLRFGDAGAEIRAEAIYGVVSAAEEIPIVDLFGMPAGVIVSDAVRMNAFRSWSAGIHTFDPADTELVAAAVPPQPQSGVRAILDTDSNALSGEVWLIAEGGIIFETSVGEDDADGEPTTITVNVTGDALFKRRLCDPGNEFTTKRYVRSLLVRHPAGSFIVTPNEFGMIGMSIDNSLASDTPLALTAGTESIDFAIAGGRSN